MLDHAELSDCHVQLMGPMFSIVVVVYVSLSLLMLVYVSLPEGIIPTDSCFSGVKPPTRHCMVR